MTKKQLLTAATSAALIGGGAGSAFANTEANIENTMDITMDIQTLLQEYIDDNGAVGASVALINNGKIQFFSYGKKSVNRDELISEDTVFEIGSITKVFTTLALMDMVAKGEVQLDDPIEIYLPGIKVPELDGKKITLRHLATHTSGIPRMPDNFDPKNPANPYEDYTVERLYDYLSHYTLTRAPGESFEYSNVGLGLLGHILSVRSAKSYEELIQSLIAEKLKMQDTSISLTAEMSQHFASGHHLRREVGYWDIPALAGAGALRSNIKDMAQFLAANMGFSQSPIATLMQQCHQKQHEVMPQLDVGLGWLTSRTDQANIIWHNGGTGGFRSFIGFNPKTQQGLVILSNSTEDWPDEFGFLVLDPGYKRTPIDRSLANDPDYLNKFVGSYNATVAPLLSNGQPNQDLQIALFGKQLSCALSCGEVAMIYPEHFGVFGVKGFAGAKVQFTLDDQGEIKLVQASLPDGTTVWEATPKPQK